jgi:DNA-binding NarL/FixJ family response regulator
MPAKTILVVDDHPLMREGLMQVISAEPGFKVIATAGSVQEALALVESENPDLVITDLTLPGRNGLELIKDLVATHPDLPVIVMSMHDELLYAERVLRAGGRGYVTKDAPPERLIQAIHTVLEGGVFASENVTNHFLRALSARKVAASSAFPLESLTDREIEVFELIGHAKSYQEISNQLGISLRTLDSHRTHIRQKLGLADSNELTRHAIRWVEIGMLGR